MDLIFEKNYYSINKANTNSISRNCAFHLAIVFLIF